MAGLLKQKKIKNEMEIRNAGIQPIAKQAYWLDA